MKSIFWRIFFYFSIFCICIFVITLATVALTSDFRPPPPPEVNFKHQTNNVLKLIKSVLQNSGEEKFKKKLRAISNIHETWNFYTESTIPKTDREKLLNMHLGRILIERSKPSDKLTRKFYYSNNKIGFLQVSRPPFKTFFDSFSSGKLFVIRLIIVLSVAIFLCYIFSLTIVNPLINLRNTYSKFGTQNLSARPESSLMSRKDEIGDLARDFNRMAENLENLINRQKKLFHEISHEFKSPLTRLQLSVETIEINDSEQHSDEIKRIKLECFRIRSLVDQILSVAKIDSGFTGPKESFRVDYLIDDLLANLSIEAKNKNISFSFKDKCSELCTSYPILFKRACENILRNSIKYSPMNSTIEIFLMFDQNDTQRCFRLIFIDQGPGISEEKISQIIGATKSNTATLAYEGSGFGLSIVHRIIKKLGGKLVLKNIETGGLQAELHINQ